MIDQPIVLQAVPPPVTSYLALAVVGLFQVVIVAVLGYVAAAWKDSRDSKAAKALDDRRRAEKQEDYKRQDEVAARVERAQAESVRRTNEVAARVEQAQAASIERTDEVARRAAESDAHIQEQLQSVQDQTQKIHRLVNSDMTAARTAERDSTKLLLAALKQVRALGLKAGEGPAKESDEAIERAEQRIQELDQILADRLAAQQAVDAEAEAMAREKAKPGA